MVVNLTNIAGRYKYVHNCLVKNLLERRLAVPNSLIQIFMDFVCRNHETEHSTWRFEVDSLGQNSGLGVY